MNILDCIAQIEKCDFECDGGPLRNNVGYIELKARIASLEAENQRLRAVIDDMATDPMGEYYTGLRCGVEDRDIACRYEAAEYGWEQAFEYIGSIATGALLGGGGDE